MSQVQPMNPYDAPEPSRPGMSGGAKLLLGMGIGCGVMLLACCGFFGFSTWWIVRTAQKSISEDPNTVRLLTDAIVTMDVPASLSPRACMDLNVPILGTQFMTWVAYGDGSDENGLFLAQFAEGFLDEDEEDIHFQWRELMRESGQRGWRDIEIEESEKHEVQINGSPANFHVAKGRESDSREEAWQVSGRFRGRGGQALIVLKVRAADFTKEQVLTLLDSMK